MIRHTPTPWIAEEVGTHSLEDGSEAPLFDIRNDGGDMIADYVSECDAPLLTAAPKLLSLLDDLSAAMETVLLQFGSKMTDGDLSARTRWTEEARQLCHRLMGRDEHGGILDMDDLYAGRPGVGDNDDVEEGEEDV